MTDQSVPIPMFAANANPFVIDALFSVSRIKSDCTMTIFTHFNMLSALILNFFAHFVSAMST